MSSEEEFVRALPLDPARGLLSVARALRTVIGWHVDARPGARTGTVGTVYAYIVAYIYLLEGVKLSPRPLQVLREIYTLDQAAECGMAYRNVALIQACLVSMAAERDVLPFGREAPLADVAATMLRDAGRFASDDASRVGPEAREARRSNARAGRHLFGVRRRKGGVDPGPRPRS